MATAVERFSPDAACAHGAAESPTYKPTVAELFRRYGAAYLAKFGDRVPAAHRQVMHAIEHCRDGAFGFALYRCDGCGAAHHVPRLCGNRHCQTGGRRRETGVPEFRSDRIKPFSTLQVSTTASIRSGCDSLDKYPRRCASEI